MVLVDDDEPHNAASIAAEDYVNTTEFFFVRDAVMPKSFGSNFLLASLTFNITTLK